MAETSKATSAKSDAKSATDDASKQVQAEQAAGVTESGQLPPKVEGLPYVTEDAAVYDGRARGDDLVLSDRNAGASHLAAQNQVPQEGALVTDPPQPVPPADANLKNQDESDENSRTTKFPKERLTGHAVPIEYPRDAQE